MGTTYYQRLKIMVADKVHSRATGQMQSLVRQPVGGKSNNGGGRIGEMERDSIISHGLSYFLNLFLMEDLHTEGIFNVKSIDHFFTKSCNMRARDF